MINEMKLLVIDVNVWIIQSSITRVVVVVAVPAQAPEVTSGGYVSIDCGDRLRCIRLYWQVI